MRPVVLVPTINEERDIAQAIIDLQQQELQIPIVVVDSSSEDGTQQIARSYGVEVLVAKRGKLNAMDQAIRTLDYDTILLGDADTRYPAGWTREITKPLSDPNVVMVSGACTFDNPAGIYDPVVSIFAPLVESLLPLTGHHWSGNTAFRKDAYLACGGYDLDIDQKNGWQVWNSEEFQFPAKMARFGTVLYAPDAILQKSSRRFRIYPETTGNFGQRAGFHF